ncbi:MAG TPA: S8 family serine peptidase, partial [Pyrinomonadaceae bacterium]|nr:S8 family serine peptidase [Pyrinomonadaceae bacterium]
DSLLSALGAVAVRSFKNLNASVLSLPPVAAEVLAARRDVRYVSLDRQVASTGHVTATTGTDDARVQTSAGLLGLLTTTTVLDGSNVGIAVLDSGIDPHHVSFRDGLGFSRIVASRDFTGEGRTDDLYGHGTHVASAAAGNGQVSNGAYSGVAPNANIVNLRVLGAEGTGTTSGLLAALDWVAANRTLYNIRVVNMSLGAVAVDSYANDPVCQAVRRLADSGVVVVAAAGNDGKDEYGSKIYGRIHSPGNEPSAITVGASNTYGTDWRGDDTVTTYSSRGPTRSYWADDAGTRHYDNLVKPDVVAPGNKVVWAEALDNRIVTAHPELDAGVSTTPARKMMYMSGTSMATPVAAGAAALLLQANPRLTPNMVKMILMYTAQPLSGFNMFEQGAGQLNIEGAVRLARAVRGDLSAATPVGSWLLATNLPAPQSEIAGQVFGWSQGIVLNRTYATGTELVTRYQRVYAAGMLLGDGVIEGREEQTVDASKMSGGVSLGENILTSGGAPVGEGAMFLSTSMLLGDGIVIGDGIVVGDGIIVGDGIVIGDGIVVGDSRVQAQSVAANGDDTSSLK